MGSDTAALPGAITVQPGEESRVFRGDASGPARPADALALIATQDESPDDGGSQSPLGVLVVGLPSSPDPPGTRSAAPARWPGPRCRRGQCVGSVSRKCAASSARELTPNLA